MPDQKDQLLEKSRLTMIHSSISNELKSPDFVIRIHPIESPELEK